MPAFENFLMRTYNVSLQKQIVKSLKINEKLPSIVERNLAKKDLF